MWTPTTRRQPSRNELRYGSDLSDCGWRLIAAWMPVARDRGRPLARNWREIVSAIRCGASGGVFHSSGRYLPTLDITGRRWRRPLLQPATGGSRSSRDPAFTISSSCRIDGSSSEHSHGSTAIAVLHATSSITLQLPPRCQRVLDARVFSSALVPESSNHNPLPTRNQNKT